MRGRADVMALRRLEACIAVRALTIHGPLLRAAGWLPLAHRQAQLDQSGSPEGSHSQFSRIPSILRTSSS